ncbi:hypothetical protein GCM10027592_47910 [Spirosoma flavus]
MKTNYTAWLSILALLITLTACQDHRIPTNPQFRIKKVIKQRVQPSSQESSTHIYSYDDQGKLAMIVTAYSMRARGGNDDVYFSSVFNYGANGKLTSLDYKSTPGRPAVYNPSRYDYEYDVTGNATRIEFAFTTSDTAYNRSYRRTYNLEYNEAKLPVKITEIDDKFNEGVISEYTYENGNVVNIKRSTFDYSGKITSSNTYTYNFDDKPNPFYGLFIGAPDPRIFSDYYTFKYYTFTQSNTFNKNNFLEPGLRYEYDSKGHLIKIVGSPTTTFEYEMY